MSVTVFANPSGIELKLPYENKDARTDGATAIINITSENVIYFNNKVVTLNDLRRLLVLSNLHNREVMIKVDRNSTMGRVSAIWDLCRSIPGVRVNVSTTY
jgi:biopolymer transport protein ExbD